MKEVNRVSRYYRMGVREREDGSFEYPDGTICRKPPHLYYAEKDKQPVEKSEPQYAGTWIPRKVMKLFWKGKITAKEAMLLATVDALVGKRGCFASNAYLAELAHIKLERTVARMIGRLKKLGLIRQIHFDGRRRYLETKWNRAGEKDDD